MRIKWTARRWVAAAILSALAGTVYVTSRDNGSPEIEVSSSGTDAPVQDDLTLVSDDPTTSTSTTAPATTAPPTTAPPAPATTVTTRPKPVVSTTTTTRPAYEACLTDAPRLAGPGIWTVTRTGESKQLVAHDPSSEFMRQVTWSPDGKHAAYVASARGSEGRLRIVDLDGRVSEPAGDQRVDQAIAWTADSRRVLYTTATIHWPPPYPLQLNAVPIEGGHPSVVWEGEWEVFGVQSIDALPDGRIVFINEDKVFSVNEDGSGYTELERVGRPENGPHYGVPRSLKVSPDGTKLAVQAGGETGIIDLGTGKVIVKGPDQYRVVEWSADSRWAAFVEHRSTTILGVDGSVHTAPGGSDVTIDPNGDTIAVATSAPSRPDEPREHLVVGPLDGPWEPSVAQAVQVAWGQALAVVFGRLPGVSGDGDLTVCALGDDKPLVRLVGSTDLQDLRWVDGGRRLALAWGY